MEGLRQDVLACFGFGTTPPADGIVKVEITVDHGGAVTTAHVDAEGAARGARSCTEAALRRARFDSFCGDDVSIAWTYSLR